MSQQAMPWGSKHGERRPDWETPTVLFKEIAGLVLREMMEGRA